MPPDASPAASFLADESTKASGSGDRAPFLTTGASFVRRTFGLLAALCFFGGESASKRKCLCAYPSAPKAHSGAYLEQPERAGILTARPRARASPRAIWGGEMVQ